MKATPMQDAKGLLYVNLCGIEHLFDRDRLQIREHGRSDFHILYIAEGKCHAVVGGQSVIAPAGSLILYMPHERQQYAFFRRDRSISCYLHFGGSLCEKLLCDLGFAGAGVYHIGKSNRLVSIIETMDHEMQLKKINYEMLCSAYLLEFLAVAGQKMKTAENIIYQKNRAMLDRVCEKMLQEYADAHPLQYYADFCNLSLGRFSHVFKEGMGVSPHEYLARIRIEKAKKLLQNSDFSIAEVAEKTGFSGQNYFSRAFKRFTGKTPREFADPK